MREETAQEKAFHDLLPPDLSEIAQVTCDYKDILRIIQEHLQTFYGKRADWGNCINAYIQRTKYQGPCYAAAKRCEELPLITVEQLYEMLREDQHYQEEEQSFLKINDEIKSADGKENKECVFRAAEMLGIMPEQTKKGLFCHLIMRDGMQEEEKREIHRKMEENISLLTLVVDLFSTLLVPGMLQTFPVIGTAMTQQKNRYFYRGESAFYGSSKPGMFRAFDSASYWERLARHLILDQACSFLDQFDAVRTWNVSGVNYLALAQHYGIQTPLLDITSDLRTALFFACCRYQNHRWRPMKKEDFPDLQEKDGSPNYAYGVLYRMPSEIMDMRYAVSEEDIHRQILPIGYQPFMRCSAQHGYTLWAENETYDMLQDPMFDKFRFHHDEEFCRWIFEEMDCGNKIYPNDDVPKLESYMEAIRNSRKISQKGLEDFAKAQRWSEERTKRAERELRRAGYAVIGGEVEYIRSNQLRKINKKYSGDVARKKLPVTPTMRPMFTI